MCYGTHVNLSSVIFMSVSCPTFQKDSFMLLHCMASRHSHVTCKNVSWHNYACVMSWLCSVTHVKVPYQINGTHMKASCEREATWPNHMWDMTSFTCVTWPLSSVCDGTHSFIHVMTLLLWHGTFTCVTHIFNWHNDVCVLTHVYVCDMTP